MYQNNISEFIKDALIHAHCPSHLIKELDNHSSIQIDLHDCPSIYISVDEDHILLWSNLGLFNENVVRSLAPDLLMELMAGFPHSRYSQLSLREFEGKLQIYTDVSLECLNDHKVMAVALNAFYESLENFMNILKS